MGNLSVNSLKSNLGSPARGFLWNVVIPNIIGGGNSDTIMLRCQSTSMPSRSLGNIAIPYQQNADLQFPGKLKYPHTWKCEFIEGEDSAILTTFYSWAQSIINDNTGLGANQQDIITDIYLQLLKTDDSQYAQYRLVDCYVDEIGEVSLDYSQEKVIQVPITFRYHHWEYSGSL